MTTKAQLAAALGTTAVLALAAGATGGYFYAKDKLGKEFDERLSAEVASAKKFYSKLHKRDEHDMPSIVETDDMLPVEREAAQAMHRYQGAVVEEEPIYETVKTHDGEEITEEIEISENNVFENNSMNLEDYETLIENRDRDSPYVITLAEHLNNDPEYNQSTLTYFLKDGILVDDRDDIVEDPDAIVGEDNLVLFGHFSGDPKTVYVRNDTIQHDFEIVRHEDSYAFVVHGLQPEPENVEV